MSPKALALEESVRLCGRPHRCVICAEEKPCQAMRWKEVLGAVRICGACAPTEDEAMRLWRLKATMEALA